MALLTGKTFGGEDWTPTFVMKIDSEKCIGCGRCFKSCARKVFMPEDLVDEDIHILRVLDGEAARLTVAGEDHR